MRKLRPVIFQLKCRLNRTNKHIRILVVVFFVCIFYFGYSFFKSNFKKKNIDIKYMLQWTPTSKAPFAYMDRGQKAFVQRNCSHQNCFVTNNRAYFKNIKDFDAILFNGRDMDTNWLSYLDFIPRKRSPNQVYMFVNSESSDYFPYCTIAYNKFFNWTWSYRIDSDVPLKYIVITNKNGTEVGPRKYMHWIASEDMAPVDQSVKEKLAFKSKAAAWFVSNCYSKSFRENIAQQLRNELNNYNLQLDIYGDCDNLTCSRKKENECFSMIEKDYFFYLSFENSLDEDYVTEKLLTALLHYAVPIVYGGANYSRFLPPNAYLDVMELGVQELAKQMKDIIENKERYYRFFDWHNHYSYLNKEKAFDAAICGLCTALNNQNRTKQKIYDNFIEWWNKPGNC